MPLGACAWQASRGENAHTYDYRATEHLLDRDRPREGRILASAIASRPDRGDQESSDLWRRQRPAAGRAIFNQDQTPVGRPDQVVNAGSEPSTVKTDGHPLRTSASL